MIRCRPSAFAAVGASLTALCGATVVAGWAANIAWIKSIVPGFTAMNPVTAICFALAGFALLIVRSADVRWPRRLASQSLALVLVVTGLFRLTSDLLGLDLAVDRLLFPASLGTNRMAPNTAWCFVLIGLSLLLIDFVPRRALWAAQVFALIVATVALVSLVGYAYGAESLYHIAYIPMALHTAVLFELISLCLLLVRPSRGVVAVLLDKGPGGLMSRRLLPAVVIVPCVFGWLRLWGEHLSLYEREFGTALLVATTVTFFAFAMLWIAAALNRSDRQRSDAEFEMQQLNADLEQRVKERTRELESRDHQLRQSQKMEAVGTLAGGVAHEFNNLLQAIQGYTRFALESLNPEQDAWKDLQQVLAASDRAAALTKQLLGFSRREMLQMADVEPNDLVRTLMKMIRPLIGEHIKVELMLDGKAGLIHGDPGHLQQMLMNLCVNARDAMPDGGQLTIKTEDVLLTDAYCEYNCDLAPGRYILFMVADTGCGMPTEVKDHIFEPFFTTKEVGKGTGLGLSMVYGLVQQHHGGIHVYSEPEFGTTFRIYLPTIDHAAAAESAAKPDPVKGGKETILVAEDDPMVRQLAVRLLSRAGYTAIVAEDGEEALRLFEQNIDTVSLVLMDVVMPRLGGREAYERIKELNPNIQAIFSSGYDPEMAQVEDVVDDHLLLIQKPFDPEVLLAAIRHTLDGEPCLTNV